MLRWSILLRAARERSQRPKNRLVTDERYEGLNKKPLLWEKGANETSTTGVAPANVTTEKTQQGNEPTGSASNHSNDSDRKDTQSYATKQVNEDKSTPTAKKRRKTESASK
ncbi:hypothetical protein [Prevotella disiens]|uniref:hypothetical protein n=1 Tax=Prevotella disiens TaxID=28130 RepID=UPI00242A7A89|nr:hypothetical protein [Prevotella disiens]